MEFEDMQESSDVDLSDTLSATDVADVVDDSLMETDLTADDYADDFFESEEDVNTLEISEDTAETLEVADESVDTVLEDTELTAEDYADDFFEVEEDCDMQLNSELTAETPDISEDTFSDDILPNTQMDVDTELPEDTEMEEISEENISEVFVQEDVEDVQTEPELTQEVELVELQDETSQDWGEQTADVASEGSIETTEIGGEPVEYVQEIEALFEEQGYEPQNGDLLEESISDFLESSEAPPNDITTKIDEIAEADLTPEHRIEALEQLKDDLLQSEMPASEETSEDSGGTAKVLKRDPIELLNAGNKNIEDILSVKEDDYRDKGYEETEIASMLAGDRVALQHDFLDDAFPGQDVSVNVFRNIGESSETTYKVPPEWNDQISDYLVPVATDIQTMNDVSDWVGDINPNFDEFDLDSPYCNNCGSCAYAVYQRLEGNPAACASAENIGYNHEMNALTGMEQVPMSPDAIRDRLLSEGDGAHAIIGIDRSEGCGHWFNAACINGEVVAIDGQTGEVCDWPPDYGDVINWEMSVKKEVNYGHKTR